MGIEFLLTQADWAAFQRLVLDRMRVRAGRARILAATVVPLGAGALLAAHLTRTLDRSAVLAFAIGILAMACSTLWASHLLRRQSRPEEDGNLLGRVRIEVTADGLRTLRPSLSATTQWSALREVTRTDTHIFLWVDRLSAHIIPLRELPDKGEALIEAIGAFAGPVTVRREGPSPLEAPGTSSAAEGPSTPAKATLRQFLAALARRLTWRALPPEAGAVGSGDAMIAACAVAALSVWLAYDRVTIGPNAEWYPGGLPGLVWYMAGVLGFAWVLHVASLRTAAFRPVLASIVGSLPFLLAAGVAIRQWVPERARPIGWAFVAVAALLRLGQLLNAAGGSRVRIALAAGAIFAVLFAQATGAAWVHPRLWYAADPDDEPDPWVASEKLIFGQADRIDTAAERMTLPRPHRPDVFFLGFAGVAEQKVFAEELALAERVVTERYGAVGRSLLLVNDRRDRERWPMATVEGLRRALARIGARMDPAEDVLFLMLTSHGSDKPELSVSNGTWPLEQLDGESLRAALDESGIRFRVIVISACHSGAFIAPLADDSTIVLTAAAKDRGSFGCDDESDVTYFGRALLSEALPQAESLQSAFERAKQLIAERERRENLQASRPQAHYGSVIRAYWAEVEDARPRARVVGRP